MVIKEHIEDFVVLAIVVGGDHPDVLAVGVLVPRRLEFFLLGGEVPNNLVGRDPLGRGGVERSFLGERRTR